MGTYARGYGPASREQSAKYFQLFCAVFCAVTLPKGQPVFCAFAMAEADLDGKSENLQLSNMFPVRSENWALYGVEC